MLGLQQPGLKLAQNSNFKFDFKLIFSTLQIFSKLVFLHEDLQLGKFISL